MSSGARRIVIEPLNGESFKEFGQVIEGKNPKQGGGAAGGQAANQGSATRFNYLAQLENLRSVNGTGGREGWDLPENLKSPEAPLNVCVFRCKPREERPFKVVLLERHKYSSQAFIPMTSPPTSVTSSSPPTSSSSSSHNPTSFITSVTMPPPSYLVVVAQNDPVKDSPDLSTLKVFHGTTLQGFNYKAGIWHHPMIALNGEIDFVCLVFERGKDQLDSSKEDTEEVFFPKAPILLHIPSLSSMSKL